MENTISTKVKSNKVIKGLAIVWLLYFTVNFINQYFHIYYCIPVRKDVFTDPIRTDGVIKSFFESRDPRGFSYPRYAQYYFFANDSIFHGSTFFAYQGNIGDTIYLLYKKSNPENNLRLGSCLHQLSSFVLS